jgi:hypothetical protein
MSNFAPTEGAPSDPPLKADVGAFRAAFAEAELCVMEQLKKIPAHEELTLLVGPTGSGKSTVAAIACKDDMAGTVCDFGICLDRAASRGDIGHGLPPGTLKPFLHERSIAGALMDMCGWLDPQGAFPDLKNAFIQKRVLSGRPIKIVLVFVRDAMSPWIYRGGPVAEFLNVLTDVISDTAALCRCTMMAVTRTDGVAIQAFLRMFLKTCPSLSPNSKALLADIIDKDKVVCVPTATSSAPYPTSEILTAFERVASMTNFHQFERMRAALTPAAVVLVRNFIQETNESTVAVLQDAVGPAILKLCKERISVNLVDGATTRAQLQQAVAGLHALRDIADLSPPTEFVRRICSAFDTPLLRECGLPAVTAAEAAIERLQWLHELAGSDIRTTAWSAWGASLRALAIELAVRCDAPSFTQIDDGDFNTSLKGGVVAMSDFVAWLAAHTVPQADDVRIKVDAIYFVIDASCLCWGARVDITCEHLLVTDSHVIDIRGRNGANGLIGAAGGAHGGRGEAGQAGGSFTVDALHECMRPASVLCIVTTGGNGGNGGNGGIGAPGLPGRDGDLGKITSQVRHCDRYDNPNGNYHEETTGVISQFRDVGTAGTCGGNGGDAGAGGPAGLPGRASLPCLPADRWLHESVAGTIGLPGAPGTGGIGGVHGRNCEGEVRQHLHWRQWWDNGRHASNSSNPADQVVHPVQHSAARGSASNGANGELAA